jgi:hypothetical protein
MTTPSITDLLKASGSGFAFCLTVLPGQKTRPRMDGCGVPAHCNGSTSLRESGIGFARRFRRYIDLMTQTPQQADAQTTVGVEAPSTEMLAPVR